MGKELSMTFCDDGVGLRAYGSSDFSRFSRPSEMEWTADGSIHFTFTNEFEVKRILQSGNRVIVFWGDDTKTIVKRSDDTKDDIYGAFTAALAIKVYGNNSQVKKVINRNHERAIRDINTGKMVVFKT